MEISAFGTDMKRDIIFVVDKFYNILNVEVKSYL